MITDTMMTGPILTSRRRLFRRVMRDLIRGVLGVLSEYEIEGTDQVPREGPLLVVLNHLGLLDGPLIVAGFPRVLDLVVLDQMLEVPVLGPLLRWYGIIPVTRDRFDRAALQQGAAVLRSGRALAIAPEAGVSETGALVPARAGVAYLALQSGAPILPVAVTGTETVHGLWDEMSKQLSFRGLENLALWRARRDKPRLTLTFGRPFWLEAAGQNWREKRQALRLATDEVMARLAELLPPQYRGVYDEALHRLGLDSRNEPTQ